MTRPTPHRWRRAGPALLLAGALAATPASGHPPGPAGPDPAEGRDAALVEAALEAVRPGRAPNSRDPWERIGAALDAGDEQALLAEALRTAGPPPRDRARAWVLYDHRDPVLAMVAAIVEPLIQRHFPRLRDRPVQLVRFESRDTYFRTDVAVDDALNHSANRVYRLYVNGRAFEDPPPLAALDAILAHELVHLRDYTHASTLGLSTLLARYLGSSRFRREYERATDVAVLELGKAEGLAAYRRWIYPRLQPRDLAEKLRTYLTPEEIQAWVEQRRRERGRREATPIDLDDLIVGDR